METFMERLPEEYVVDLITATVVKSAHENALKALNLSEPIK
jgi:hypothetical protein